MRAEQEETIMPTVIQGVTYYSPSEVAKRLGVSTAMVRYWRNEGRIEGTQMGNSYGYTEEQIQAANTERLKRGPKTGDDKDKSGGTKPSVVLSTLCAASPSYDAYFTRVG